MLASYTRRSDGSDSASWVIERRRRSSCRCLLGIRRGLSGRRRKLLSSCWLGVEDILEVGRKSFLSNELVILGSLAELDLLCDMETYRLHWSFDLPPDISLIPLTSLSSLNALLAFSTPAARSTRPIAEAVEVPAHWSLKGRCFASHSEGRLGRSSIEARDVAEIAIVPRILRVPCCLSYWRLRGRGIPSGS